MERKLTPKQEKFCHAYLETGNASEAYRSSYNASRMKHETINVKAVELLNNGKVAVRVQELKDKLRRTHDIRKDEILYDLEAILGAKITDYMELTVEEVPILYKGIPTGATQTMEVLKFKDFSQLTEQQVRAIESMKQTKFGIELKLHNKLVSIERIVKMLGYEAPKKLDVKSGDKEISGYVLVLPSNGREVKKEDNGTEDN